MGGVVLQLQARFVLGEANVEIAEAEVNKAFGIVRFNLIRIDLSGSFEARQGVLEPVQERIGDTAIDVSLYISRLYPQGPLVAGQGIMSAIELVQCSAPVVERRHGVRRNAEDLVEGGQGFGRTPQTQQYRALVLQRCDIVWGQRQCAVEARNRVVGFFSAHSALPRLDQASASWGSRLSARS